MHLRARAHLKLLLARSRAASSVASSTQQETWQRSFVEFVGPGQVRVGKEAVPLRAHDEMTVQATLSAISSGTERHVLAGSLVAAAEPADVSIGALGGEAPAWPMRYGYALVGHVMDGTSWCSLKVNGTRVFCFHPHASIANVAASDVREIPDDVDSLDAAFFASMETALSLVQDAAPIVGDRVAVFGAGTVGALSAAILGHHGFRVGLYEPNACRMEAVVAQCSKVQYADPAVKSNGFDVLIETSGSAAGLAKAVCLAKRGGRIVVGSWYGEDGVMLPLGLRFHRSELTVVSSQVSRVSAALSTRWPKERRADLAWSMLGELRPSQWVPLLKSPVESAADAYRDLGKATQVLLTYHGAE